MLSLLNQTLEQLDLSGNNLSGPDILKCCALHNFSFSGLNLSGNPLAFDLSTLSDDQFLLTFKDTIVDLSHCSLYGPLTLKFRKEFCDPYFDIRINSGDTLDLSYNKLTGEIPITTTLCGLRLFSRVLLNNNLLVGRIPSELGAIASNIHTLKLNDNRLEGDIPPSILNITKLELLDLRNNRLQGDFATLFSWVKPPIPLIALLLSNNRITGSIPPSFGAFAPYLQLVDISRNSLTGVIPANLSLQAFNLASSANTLGWRTLYEEVQIVVKGVFTTYTYELQVLTALHISDNHLTGAIPPELGNLAGLYSLNLSRNMLSGSIPATLSNLRVLESMDLSFNQLQGQIPSDFSKLDRLETFDVSYNKALEGPIPSGSVFTPNSFKGDPGLCGQPILDKCNQSKGGSKVVEEEDEHSFSRWIKKWIALPGLCLGLVVGFVETLLALHARSCISVLCCKICALGTTNS
ncbi:hypothetical protein L7F22_047005 [Adiantum nelumboides]|nr:hypothetical protein [Adiantum nelumboides]